MCSIHIIVEYCLSIVSLKQASPNYAAAISVGSKVMCVNAGCATAASVGSKVRRVREMSCICALPVSI